MRLFQNLLSILAFIDRQRRLVLKIAEANALRRPPLSPNAPFAAMLNTIFRLLTPCHAAQSAYLSASLAFSAASATASYSLSLNPLQYTCVKANIHTCLAVNAPFYVCPC